MVPKYDLYTGYIDYEGVRFTFVFDGTELRLIPPEDKRTLVEWDWRMKKIRPGVSTFADPIPVEDTFLIGKCNETKCRIVFFPKPGSTLGFCNSIVHIALKAYIICKYDRDMIDRVSFSCPELNYIHPVNQAISLTLPADESQNKGVIGVSTRDFETTTTKKQSFLVDNVMVTSFFGIVRNVSTRINEPPLRLDTALMFEFNASNDYGFVYRLWEIANNFVRFLCYRKNVFMTTVELSAPYEGGKHEAFATMYILGQDGETETEALLKGCCIKQTYIAGHEGRILSDIANNSLYLRHLPETYHSGRHINAARFVMITAAFEWEFHRSYPEGIEKSPKTIQAEEAVLECMQNLVDESTGKQKKIYKFLKRLVKSDSLQSEIVQIGEDFTDIIGAFGKHLYQRNNQELKYSDMGQRLSDQRNHFAHGDLDKVNCSMNLNN